MVDKMAIKGFNETFLTYKENVPDTRESPVREMMKELYFTPPQIELFQTAEIAV